MRAAASFAERLISRIRAVESRVCVGCDPDEALLPPDLTTSGDVIGAVERFGLGLIKAVTPHAAAIKFQSAFYERLGSAGIRILEKHLAVAKRSGMIVILDAKRGDVGHTTCAYADAYLRPSSPLETDALTVAPYLGSDTLRAFGDAAKESGKGLFVLVKTSNPSARDVQDVRCEDGLLVHEKLSLLVAELGAEEESASGYSSFGAVVGATYPETIGRLRALMPRQFFLLPGVGAQGGDVHSLRAAFDDDGLGALVAASRSVAFAWKDAPGMGWEAAAAAAARALADDVNRVIGV